jgi:hypothetical protein
LIKENIAKYMKFFSLPLKEFEIPGKAECLKMCSEEEV